MIALVTENGTLLLEAGHGDCIGCKRSGGGMAKATLSAVGLDDVQFIVCGNCVATGLRDVIAKATETRPEPPERLRFEESSLD